jgi:insertion element IS1 protein InsB
VAADDLSRLVHKKANQPWIWLAMDAKTRQVMALHVGDRSRKRAKRLWAKIPQASRPHATFSTAHSMVSAGVIPAAQQRAISQLARKTHHRERFNTTRRPRVSRLVRDALACSKKLAYHSGASKLFICYSNLTRAAA